MAEPLSLRVKRVVHSLRDDSAWRIARFLRDDARDRAAVTPVVSDDPVAGSYRNDVVTLDDADPDDFPPVIFQTWKSRSVIPGNYRHWRQTFVDTNPDCRVLLWDDADNRAFIADRFAWALPVYDSYPQEIFRADAVRFFFLLEFGGLYADMDTECLRPIRPSASTGAVVLCRMGGNPDFAHAIPNAIMASRPSQIFWLFAIHCMIEAAERIPDAAARIAAGPETMTGPVLLKQAYDAFVALDEAAVMALLAPLLAKLTERQRTRLRYARPTLLDGRNWYPLDWTNMFHKRLCNRLRTDRRILPIEVGRTLFPDAAVVTYWSHSL
nr:glycosyltransferase [Sphingomonas sp. PvP018]